MSIDKEVIPLEAFFAADSLAPNPESDPREALRLADVIIGVDFMSQREFVVYGRHILEEIATTGVKKNARVLKIGVDQETDELDKLVALVEVSKGSQDYGGMYGSK